MTKTKLQINYENACNAYLENFCARHEFDLDDASWVGGRVGGVADCSEIYVDIETIRVDVDSCCDPKELFKWYEYSVRAGVLGVVTPNFDSWLRKCPVRTEEELAEMEMTRGKIEELERELTEMAKGSSPLLP